MSLIYIVLICNIILLFFGLFLYNIQKYCMECHSRCKFKNYAGIRFKYCPKCDKFWIPNEQDLERFQCFNAKRKLEIIELLRRELNNRW